jgi:hypothetical protein
MPRFSGDNAPRIESFDWCTEHRDELTEKRSAAARAMFDKHEAEQLAAQAQAQTPGPTQAQTLGQTPMRTSAQMGAMARPKTGREAW